LLPDYEQLAPTYLLQETSRRAGLAKRVLRRLHVIPRPSRLPRALAREHIDLVYLNTVAVAHLARELKATWQAPFLLHLLELEMSIRLHCGSDRLRAALTHVDGCVTGTRVAVDLLRDRYGFPPERIHRVSVGLALPARDSVGSPEARRALRAELRIPP